MIFLRALGLIFLVLGGIGLFLPVWPTTIFWIIAALCFVRSHPPTRDWIYARPGIGPQIRQFIEQGSLSHRSKISALIGMFLGFGLSIFLLWSHWLWLGFASGLILAGALYVASRPIPSQGNDPGQ